MPSFEEEAFTRAQQMHSKMPYRQKQNYAPPQRPESNKQPPEPIEKPEHKADYNSSESKESLIDIIFKNKDQSIILLLIVLLMEENTEPTILLALMYLLL